jgi:F-type H+-transporting ATPase subunit epsilon
MSSQQLTITLTTPERQVLSVMGESISIPTVEGELTILPGHAPLVALLVSGMATVRRGSEEEYLAVSGGFVQIEKDTVAILADTAERAEELDVAKIEEARERARALLTEERRKDDVSAAAALAGLERELARLRVAQKHRTRRSMHLPSSTE